MTVTVWLLLMINRLLNIAIFLPKIDQILIGHNCTAASLVYLIFVLQEQTTTTLQLGVSLKRQLLELQNVIMEGMAVEYSTL